MCETFEVGIACAGFAMEVNSSAECSMAWTTGSAFLSGSSGELDSKTYSEGGGCLMIGLRR